LTFKQDLEMVVCKEMKKNKLNKVNEVLFSKKQSIPVSQRSKDKDKN